MTGADRRIFAYGSRQLEVTLPPAADVRVLEPARADPHPDPRGHIRDVLRHPLQSPPLAELVRPGDRVAIVVSDHTRVTGHDLFLPLLLEELGMSGAAAPEVLFASGAHRPMSRAGMRAALGNLAGQVPFHAHRARDHRNCEYLGRTSRGTPVLVNRRAARADHLILTGSVVHHPFAGFGGGLKAVFPGLAALPSIQANHRLMLEPGARSGALDGNPVHEDLAEAGALARPRFILNTVLDSRGRLVRAFAGLAAAHRAACTWAARTREVPLAGPADLVVASPGGHPWDIDLYQSQKALENAARAVRPGGAVILLAACPAGTGHPAFERWARSYRTFPELTAALARRFELGGHKAWALARITGRATVFLVSDLDPATARIFGLEPAPSPRVALERSLRLVGGKPLVYLMPAAGTTVPVLGQAARPGGPR